MLFAMVKGGGWSRLAAIEANAVDAVERRGDRMVRCREMREKKKARSMMACRRMLRWENIKKKREK